MSYVLGIDLSSQAIDLVRLDEDSNAATWTRLRLEGETSFARCRSVAPAMAALGSGFYDGIYLAALERPKTHSFVSAAAQFPVFGAVLAALPAALEAWDVSPGDWRKGLGLKGNATKEECAEVVQALLFEQPARTDYPHWPQDALDAFAVAFYARELNARGISADEAREKQLVLVPAAAEPPAPAVPFKLEG